ncbi:MAG: nuclear transport factor 2 family protein [Acidimicrobiia bacterium]|nr:nuclear transport factor 2 family protein [Acidimicrobiia bacterium]
MLTRESPELQAVCRRWLTAVAEADSATIANLYSQTATATYLGSDNEEFWVGRDVGVAVARHWAEVAETLGASITETAEIDAYENGPTGWGLIRTAVSFADLGPFPFRITLVFVLDDGAWRIAQTHNSVAADNFENVGVPLTTTLEDLVDALDDESESRLRSAVPQGTVTLMFTDIEDSTKMATRLGDQAWSSLIRHHDRTIDDIAGKNGGVLVKTLGDGAMVAFNSTRDAVTAAREVQSAFQAAVDGTEIRARIGLHVGDAVRTGDDYLGLAVNKAARIAAAARGGETLISDAVRMLLGEASEIAFGEPFDTDLKGLSGTHTLMLLR